MIRVKQVTTYTQSTHVLRLGDRPFTARNFVPELEGEERHAVKTKIEGALYDIFHKYMT